MIKAFEEIENIITNLSQEVKSLSKTGLTQKQIQHIDYMKS